MFARGPGREVRVGARVSRPSSLLRVSVERHAKANLTARQALEWAGDRLNDGRSPLVAFVSTPSRWATCVVEAGELAHLDGPIDYGNVFEMRIVSSRGELRWISEGPSPEAELRGRSSLALLSEPPGEGVEFPVLPRFYLCWGAEARGPVESGVGFDWWEIGDTSIGSMVIPLGRGQQTRPVRLSVRELIEYDDFGNARVVDEVCVGFAWLEDGEGGLNG